MEISRKFPKFYNFENHQISQIAEKQQILKISENFQLGRFQKFIVWKIKKTSNSGNLKSFQFGVFQKLPTWKFPKIHNLETSEKFPKFYNSENHQISQIFEFQKMANFQNLTISQTIKIP